MSNTTVPSFTDNISLLAVQALARGSVLRATYDLSAVYGAWLYLRLGRGGTTALTNGVDVHARRLINGTTIKHPTSAPRRSQFAAASASTVATTANAGDTTLVLASGTGFAAGDTICIDDSGHTRTEWCRVANKSTNTLTLDAPLQYQHTSGNADPVRNKADVFAPWWLPGGSQYEVIFDYGDDTAGESVTVEAWLQKYNSDVTT